MATGHGQSRLRSGGHILLILLLLCAAPVVLRAFTLETLIMPGPVIETHAQFEDDCANCHEDTEADSQAELCMGCHVDVGADVVARTGFHGRHPDAGDNECVSCHTDHEGRAADIVAFDVTTFDHSWTDFAFRGEHEMLQCSGCHEPGADWAASPNTCFGCHAQDDIHLRQMEGTCGDCHSQSTWRDATFDHDMTAFPLMGQHGNLTCDDCHQDQVFHGVPTECSLCHVNDDVHQGRNGTQCASCHSAVDWADIHFDHLTVSSFALLGAHERLACETCHTQDFTTSLPTSCHGCHQTDDVHQGGLGADCASCHSVSTWTNTGFDHSAIMRFPLLGAHNALECTSCHLSGTDVGLPLDCAGCHADDPHVGQLGSQCETCHSEITWTAETRFDHGLTNFPLIGAHATIACETCHATLAFHDAAENCAACHSAEDVHGGRLGPQCETCHNPGTWAFWTFDHDIQTDFTLTGEHLGAACTACHRNSTTGEVTAPAVCGQCHRQDDPHFGRFGTECGACHTTASFSDIQDF